MRAMIVLSFLVASVTCEAFYAPNFAYAGLPYAAAGLPYAAAGLPYAARAPLPAYTYTALDTFPYTYAHGLPLNFAAAPVVVAADAAAVVEPAVKKIESETVEKVESEEDIAVDVIEADDSPIIPTGPVQIRRIFPIFNSDLRGAITDVNFLRPGQVRPILPAEEDDDIAVVVPDFKSLLTLPIQARF